MRRAGYYSGPPLIGMCRLLVNLGRCSAAPKWPPFVNRYRVRSCSTWPGEAGAQTLVLSYAPSDQLPRRHRYASHGLRFRVKSATESAQRLPGPHDEAARDEEEGAPAGVGGDEWLLGAFRDRGSIHCDIWRGTAVDLAERDAIGVFPVAGWWKEKPFLNATMRWLATL